MHQKVSVKLEKNPKNPLVWAKKPKKTQKTQKTQKNPEKPQKTRWAGFLFKKPGFFQPWFPSLASLANAVQENTFLPWLVLVGLVEESNFPTSQNYPPPL